MKILDRYILTSFVTTFASVFVILFFIFILQTVWMFIAELAGKDLDFALIIKFLMFAMPRIIPLVLPLSVLLASIMTFGSFSENYEFAAMKSSGISLRRAMHALVVFIMLLSVASFFFANNVIPYAEYKFITFRTDIAQRQPAMAITEGQFSEVGTYTIKVDKKSGQDGKDLTGVTIHKKSNINRVATTVIRAKTGQIVSSEGSNVLQLILNDGYYYEDITPKKYEDRQKLPFAKSAFKRYTINMDLSGLSEASMGDDQVVATTSMLTVNELVYTLDSLRTSYAKDRVSFADNIYQRTGITSFASRPISPPDMSALPLTPKIPAPKAKDSIVPKSKFQKAENPTAQLPLPQDLLSGLTPEQQQSAIKIALGNVESTAFSIEGSRFEIQERMKNINSHELALYDKFVIAYACVLMFFIGAPLGAIIRKGGLGLPIVFAVLIFIAFHFINTFGKKMAQSDSLPPFLGAWLSSFILTPFAVLLTYRATNDIGLFSLENILEPIQNFFRKIFPKKATTP